MNVVEKNVTPAQMAVAESAPASSSSTSSGRPASV